MAALSTGARFDFAGWLRRSVWPIYVIGFLPAALYFWWGLNNQLGPDPIRAFEHALGLWSLRFLIITLAITPIRHLTAISFLRYRRAFGLLAFWYAGLHLTVYAVLDKALDWSVIIEDIVKRPFITIGMAAFLLLVPLALTSNMFSIRRLGSRWQLLHKASYLIAGLAAIHFLMAVKSWPAEPVIHAAIVAGLLLFRPLARFIPKRRPKPQAKPQVQSQAGSAARTRAPA